VQLFFIAGLLLTIQAFTYQLSNDPLTGLRTGSRLIQVISLSVLFYSLVLLHTSRDSWKIVTRCWPILFLAGLGLLSATWSINSSTTVRATYNFLSVSLVCLAMAARFSPLECLRIVLRMMTLGCVMSILWAQIFPEVGVHQATDLVQMVHAGLWRGIFTHKQGLGVFSSLTLGLLLFYGSVAFPMLIVRVAAIACAGVCLYGTGSVTGLLTASILTMLLYITRWISHVPRPQRAILIRALIFSLSAIALAFNLGWLDFVPILLGKTADLNGRSDMWPYVLALTRSSYMLFGRGLGTNFSNPIFEGGISIDNGYVDVTMELGYVGAAAIMAIYGGMLWAGGRLIERTPPDSAGINLFPFCYMVALFVINVSEGLFMKREIATVLFVLAISFIFREAPKIAQTVQGIPSGKFMPRARRRTVYADR
jgi:exopolysaccharide production protein ExoQ